VEGVASDRATFVTSVLPETGAGSMPSGDITADFSLPIACPDLDYFRFGDNPRNGGFAITVGANVCDVYRSKSLLARMEAPKTRTHESNYLGFSEYLTGLEKKDEN
jgi:hypothetical protein